MELCSNTTSGVVCNKKHLRRLCPPKLAADVAADPAVDDATVGFVTTYVAEGGMPTFEVEVDDVDVQRYESMFPSLPDEMETEMADHVVAPIAPAGEGAQEGHLICRLGYCRVAQSIGLVSATGPDQVSEPKEVEYLTQRTSTDT
jgi:hypothetical protein